MAVEVSHIKSSVQAQVSQKEFFLLSLVLLGLGLKVYGWGFSV